MESQSQKFEGAVSGAGSQHAATARQALVSRMERCICTAHEPEVEWVPCERCKRESAAVAWLASLEASAPVPPTQEPPEKPDYKWAICECQGDDPIRHTHYDIPGDPHSCARCGHKNCPAYAPKGLISGAVGCLNCRPVIYADGRIVHQLDCSKPMWDTQPARQEPTPEPLAADRVAMLICRDVAEMDGPVTPEPTEDEMTVTPDQLRAVVVNRLTEDRLARPEDRPTPENGEWVFVHTTGEWRCHCGYVSTSWDFFVAHFNAPSIALIPEGRQR